ILMQFTPGGWERRILLEAVYFSILLYLMVFPYFIHNNRPTDTLMVGIVISIFYLPTLTPPILYRLGPSLILMFIQTILPSLLFLVCTMTLYLGNNCPLGSLKNSM